MNTGLRTEQVLELPVVLLSFGDGDFKRIMASVPAVVQGYGRIKSEIRALPGVSAVGVASTLPLHGGDVGMEVKAEGRSFAVGEAAPRADLRTADPDFFQAAGVPRGDPGRPPGRFQRPRNGWRGTRPRDERTRATPVLP